jgi:hypothetical protein
MAFFKLIGLALMALSSGLVWQRNVALMHWR